MVVGWTPQVVIPPNAWLMQVLHKCSGSNSTSKNELEAEESWFGLCELRGGASPVCASISPSVRWGMHDAQSQGWGGAREAVVIITIISCWNHYLGAP